MLHYWPFFLLIPQVWAIIDFLRRKPEPYWFWIIIFFGPIGPLIYYIAVVVTKEGAVDVAGKIKKGRKERSRMKDLLYKVDTEKALPYDYHELGELLWHYGKYEKAAEVLIHGIKKAPENLESYYYLGRVFETQERFEEAGSVLEKLVMRDPRFKSGEAMHALARCYKGAGETDAAISAYQRVLNQSSFAQARYELAELFIEKGDMAQAARELQTIINEATTTDMPEFHKGNEQKWAKKAKSKLSSLK